MVAAGVVGWSPVAQSMVWHDSVTWLRAHI